MAARIVRISAHKSLLRRNRTVRLRQLALELAPEAPGLSREILAVIDRNTASEDAWRFVMFGPLQNRIVVRWIDAHAKRQRLSSLLWAELFCNFHPMTGQVLLNRTQMAEAIGHRPQHVSAALSELLSMGALIRRQEGRDVTWFMNPLVATCVTGAARDEAQRSAPPLLSVMQGGVSRDAT
jgi:CRP-like cAMP-binding protein